MTRGLLALVLLLWLLFAVSLAALHWWIVPWIDNFRPQLQAQASQALGIPVRIGAVLAHSEGLMSELELRQVELLDDRGQVVLRLPRVQASVSVNSLWRLGFEQIFIDQPQLDIRRDARGQITVAGFVVDSSSPVNQAALDWFFSQRELMVRNAQVRYNDELRGAEPVLLTALDVTVRNTGRHHELRIEATPPDQWGARFSLQGQLLQPLLADHNGRWQDWSGQLFASFDRLDLSESRRFVDLGIDLRQGLGALRVWAKLHRGQLVDATADVALAQLAFKLGADLPPLSLQNIQGRLTAQRLETGFEVDGQSLRFDINQNQHWPSSNFKLRLIPARADSLAHGQLWADRVDVALLAQIMTGLPLDAKWRQALISYAPQGQLQTLAANWQAAPEAEAPVAYQVAGQLRQFTLAAVGDMPGIDGLNADFDLDQTSGRAKLMMAHGSIDAPTFFQQPRIAVDRFSARAAWHFDGAQLALEVSQAAFGNADAQGQARFKWHSGAPGSLGELDLQASLSHARGDRVYHYLPLVISAEARNYVRDAMLAASASNVQFNIRGKVDDMPATRPKQGVFKISADISAARMAYLPKSLQQEGEKPWPQLTDLSGKLLIDGMRLQVKDGHAKLDGRQALAVSNINVNIDDLEHTRVQASADLKGSIKEALQVVNQSALADLTNHALAQTLATGGADLSLKLDLPIAQIWQSTLQGSITLADNMVQIAPTSPRLDHASGAIHFDQAGFGLAGVQGQMLGGTANLSGGLLLNHDAIQANKQVRTVLIRGTASAQGLRQAQQLGWLAQLAQNFSGASDYLATLDWQDGNLKLLVDSDLQGLASSLPAPLQKSAVSRLPMRYQSLMLGDAKTTAARRERLNFSLEGLLQATYELDLSQASPKPLHGLLLLGAPVLGASEPAQGVTAHIALAQLDVDAWLRFLQTLSNQDKADVAIGSTAWLPSSVTLRTPLLTLGERSFKQVQISAQREAALWRIKAQTDELAGYLQYRTAGKVALEGGGAQLYARLSKLSLAPVAATQLESWIDAQPSVLPALDLVVNDFEWSGKELGRLEIEAINRLMPADNLGERKNEWQLKQLKLINPSATLSASGNWALIRSQVSDLLGVPASQRRTALDFKLQIRDAGALLGLFGMQDVIRRGSGKIEGHLAWAGSPLEIDYPSLSGAFGVNVGAGQFLKADPGIAKLLGVLSLQTLPRRLTLDFRDVFSQGFAFDMVLGDVTLEHGMARTNNLKMTGVNAAVLMQGWANIVQQTQDLHVVVVPEINAGTASLIATAINPAVGLGSLLAQWLLRRPLINANTRQFHIDGAWDNPHITPISSASAAIMFDKNPAP